MTTIYYLEMHSPGALRRSAMPDGFSTALVSPPDGTKNRAMYRSVGGPWGWNERLAWSEDDWRVYANRGGLETWLGLSHGDEAGYFELEAQAGGNVQIMYFGLLPAFFGQGLGGALLTGAVERAWQLPETRRVWVHTCTKDHEHALANYQKRGFEIYNTKVV